LACVLYRQRDDAKLAEAAMLMRQAAGDGDIPAMVHMSRFYKFGIGVEKNERSANGLFSALIYKLYTPPTGQDYTSQHRRVFLAAMYAHPRCGPIDREAADRAEKIQSHYETVERQKTMPQPSKPASGEGSPRAS
jgi:hypothetical protein